MRVGRAVAVLLAVVVLVAGCTSKSGGDGSSSGPGSQSQVVSSLPSSVTTSPSPSVSTPTVPSDVPTTGKNLKPGEKPPVEPVAATQHTLAGATAFAKFFIQTIDWGFATTSATYMRHYFQTSCVECKGHADSLDATSKDGGYYVGGRFTIASAHDGGTLAAPAPTVKFGIASVESLDAHGKFRHAEPAYPAVVATVNLSWTESTWVVTSMRSQL